MTEMIEGISPLHISRFQSFRANSSYHGKHPLINVYVRRKYPILSKIPLLRLIVLYDERIFRPAYFNIIGSNDRILKTVVCRNSAELDERVIDARIKLEQFIVNIQLKEENNE